MPELMQHFLDLEMKTDGDVNNPHCKFRSLSLLLTLVSALNHDGHSILGTMEGTHGPVDTPQTPIEMAINAFAAVLVRNNEVIAVLASSPHTPLKFVTLQDVNDVDRIGSESFQNCLNHLTAVANPRDGDGDVMNADCVTLHVEGSKWKPLNEHRWQEISSDE
jgi:hypothetical protein